MSKLRRPGSWWDLCCPGALVLGAICILASTTQSADLVVAEVRHVSRSSIYIDKGETNGLTIESELTVYRGGKRLGELEVSYLARHSASCRVVTAKSTPQPGDEVHYQAVDPPMTPATAPLSLQLDPNPGRPLVLSQRDLTVGLSGRLALEWDAFSNDAEGGGDFQRPSVYLRLNSPQFLGRPLELDVRVRGEYLRRFREVGTDLPETSSLYRLYRLSLTYADARSPYRFAVGRLYSEDLRGAGNWDGGLVEYGPGKHWRVGLFGGGKPELTNGEPAFDVRTFSGYVSFAAGLERQDLYEGTVGIVGQYGDDGASREFVIATNEVSMGPQLRLRQDLELDLEDGGPTLSRLNLLLDGRLSERLRANLGYDYFRNVRRLDTLDLPDSLFFDPRLQGVRFGTSYKLSSSWALRARLGVRDQEDEEKQPIFASAGASWTDALGTGTQVQLRYSYSDGRLAESHAPALDLQRHFGPVFRLGLGVGLQTYEGFDRDSLSVDGQWFRFHGTYLMARGMDLQWQYGYASGDIAPGSRILLRLGYRL